MAEESNSAHMFDFDGDVREERQEDHSMLMLTTTWLNERHSPELLPFRQDIVDPLVRRISKQKKLVLDNKNTDVNTAFIANLHLAEIERLKYILRSYLRTRLYKIEKFNDSILSTPALKDRLSVQEFEYANKYRTLRHRTFLELGASRMPLSSSADDAENGFLNQPEMRRWPEIDRYVAVRIKRHLGEIQLDPASRESVLLQEGQIYVLRYRLIQSLLLDDLVELV